MLLLLLFAVAVVVAAAVVAAHFFLHLELNSVNLSMLSIYFIFPLLLVNSLRHSIFIKIYINTFV